MDTTARIVRGPARRRGRAVIVTAALALAALAGPAEAYWLPTAFGANDPFRLVAIGDSITEGYIGSACDCLAAAPYPAVLQALLSPRHPGVAVVNAGRGGETTDGGLARLPSVLAAERPGFVLIMEGTNDATLQAFHGDFDPGIIKDNLQAMVRLAKANGSVPILATIPPNFRSWADEPRRIIDAVNAMLPGVAAAEQIPLVDIHAAMNDPALFGPDDLLHPTEAGYAVMAGAWQPAASQALDESLAVVAQAYLLRFDKERFRAGEILTVDLTVRDQLSDALVDVYFGLMLPLSDRMDDLGCPGGGVVVYLADGFTRSVFRCLADPPEEAVPLYRDLALVGPIPVVTVPAFWRALLTPEFPPGAYLLFLAITPAGDPTRTLVTSYHAFSFAP